MDNKNTKIGFIGQGWIGKNYADNFELRGFDVLRYSLEPEYVCNKDKIKECEIVFIAVPTPTHNKEFDDSIVRSSLGNLSDGTIAVIKSTLLPGTTKKIQGDFTNLKVLINPEFLSVATARHDADFPTRNIVGVPVLNEDYKAIAKRIVEILPHAPFELVCDSTEAELIKYARNCIGYARVLMTNIFYDLSIEMGVDYSSIQKAISADPDNGPAYSSALHKSGRGAGGECFIKDFAAFAKFYQEHTSDLKGSQMLDMMESKNIELLKQTNKDKDILKNVYGI